MYQALLTRRYLTHKVMPLLAAVAVTLCTAMVLVVWSIMGGFLVMLLDYGRGVEGDVRVSWPTVGFAYYEELIDRLEADPMVRAAAPVIESFGMVGLPDDRVQGVQIKGVDPRFAEVTNYEQALWWQPIKEPLPKDREGQDPRLDPGWPAARAAASARDFEIREGAGVRPEAFRTWEQMLEDGLRLQETDPRTGRPRPAVVLGIELGDFSQREAEGYYQPAFKAGRRGSTGGLEWMSGFVTTHDVTINVLPLDAKGRNIGVVSRRLPVANEMRTGIYEADKSTVLIRLEELQRMLKMDAAERLEESPGAGPVDPYAIEEGPGGVEREPERAVVGVEPARVTSVLIRGRDGVDSEALRERAIEVYAGFADAHPGEVPTPEEMSRTITTFARSQATFIGAVEKETIMVMGMLLFISFVSVFLILAIFWSMVSEKTKDIGVLRSVGASRAGVAWLWLRYGMVIGVMGAALGGVLAYAIVWNINPIHDWLGRAFGVSIWDPRVYYFPEIPNVVIPWKAALVLSGGVVFSVMGAVIPAVKAARMDPVRALRFE